MPVPAERVNSTLFCCRIESTLGFEQSLIFPRDLRQMHRAAHGSPAEPVPSRRARLGEYNGRYRGLHILDRHLNDAVYIWLHGGCMHQISCTTLFPVCKCACAATLDVHTYTTSISRVQHFFSVWLFYAHPQSAVPGKNRPKLAQAQVQYRYA